VGKRIYEDAMKQETQYVFDNERVEIVKNAVKHITMRNKYPKTKEMCHSVCNCKISCLVEKPYIIPKGLFESDTENFWKPSALNNSK
jgi:hypothetical protein